MEKDIKMSMSESDYQEIKEFIDTHPEGHMVTDWLGEIEENFSIDQAIITGYYARYEYEKKWG